MCRSSKQAGTSFRQPLVCVASHLHHQGGLKPNRPALVLEHEAAHALPRPSPPPPPPAPPLTPLLPPPPGHDPCSQRQAGVLSPLPRKALDPQGSLNQSHGAAAARSPSTMSMSRGAARTATLVRGKDSQAASLQPAPGADGAGEGGSESAAAMVDKMMAEMAGFGLPPSRF